MLQNVWNLSGSTASSQSIFVTILLAIIVGWILVSLWTRVIENVSFGTLKFNENSAWHSFLIAAGVTAIFVVFVWMVDEYDIVPGGIEGDIEGSEGVKNVSFTDDIVSPQGNSVRSTHLNHFSNNQNGNPLALFG